MHQRKTACAISCKPLLLLLMKGENTLYKSVVPSSLTQLKGGKKSQRNTYLDRRSDAMACRYYYHSTICRLRYDDCLLSLSMEFNLEPDTIIGYLQKRLGYVNSMVRKETPTSELRQQYPWFDWSGKPYSLVSL